MTFIVFRRVIAVNRNNKRVLELIISMLVLIFMIISISCSSIDPKIYEFIDNNELDKLEEYCNTLKGDSQKECYIVLAEEYYNKKNYMKAGKLYEKAGKKREAIKCYLIINREVKIIELNLEKEYVLIKNLSRFDVSLKGWKLSDEEENHSFIFEEYLLKTDSTLQMQSGKEEDRISKKENEYEYILWSEKNVWNNSGDTAFLTDNFGNLVSKLEQE